MRARARDVGKLLKHGHSAVPSGYTGKMTFDDGTKLLCELPNPRAKMGKYRSPRAVTSIDF